ncbi:hypothetical protein CDAR_34771 [Caerostris darwini]|uniref:Uncharacterized protein n=1 Tax=Caerostris darwini TaxID=1538125 RepID=A0AAV4RWP1_9ARAC|nr:hypothetical protein CDAR_34771 [Caerostris darwini]
MSVTGPKRTNSARNHIVHPNQSDILPRCVLESSPLRNVNISCKLPRNFEQHTEERYPALISQSVLIDSSGSSSCIPAHLTSFTLWTALLARSIILASSSRKAIFIAIPEVCLGLLTGYWCNGRRPVIGTGIRLMECFYYSAGDAVGNHTIGNESISFLHNLPEPKTDSTIPTFPFTTFSVHSALLLLIRSHTFLTSCLPDSWSSRATIPTIQQHLQGAEPDRSQAVPFRVRLASHHYAHTPKALQVNGFQQN